MSFRDIAMIIKKYEKQKENENKDKLRRDKSKNINKESAAYDLFLNGKTPTQVSIELNINSNRIEKLYTEFWRLQGLHKLYEMYIDNQNELLEIINLCYLLKYNNIQENKIVNIINNVDKISTMEKELDNLKSNLIQIRKKNDYLIDENRKLYGLNDQLKNEIEQSEINLQTKRLMVKFHEEELENIEKLIEAIKSTDDFKKIKNAASEIVSDFINKNKYLLNFVVESVFDNIKKDKDKKDIIDYFENNYYSNMSMNYLSLGHNYSIFITNKASLLMYDILVINHTNQQTSPEKINIIRSN